MIKLVYILIVNVYGYAEEIFDSGRVFYQAFSILVTHVTWAIFETNYFVDKF